jgi:uncharacterized membrane protein YeaQ/YmgE (transglycosylase-associated protein family)
MIETIIMWVVVGFLAGLLAKAVVPGTRDEPSGFWGTTFLGIIGAVVGGFIFAMVTGYHGFVTRFDLPSILWAAIGAVVVVFIARMFNGRRTI